MRPFSPLTLLLVLVGCSNTNDNVSPPPSSPPVDNLTGSVNGLSWTSATVKGVYLPDAKVLSVSATNLADPRIHHLALFVQNLKGPGTFSITGFNAGASITDASDSTFSINDSNAGDPGAYDDISSTASYGSITIGSLSGGRIQGTFSFSRKGVTGNGSFNVAYP